MNAAATLYRTTVGKKVAMAVSGAVIVGWLFFHMVGNLLVFAGPEALDAYGEFLQHGTHGAIWAMRAFMLAMVVIHVASVVSLIRTANKARSVGYQGGRQNQATTAAARSMRFGGIALLAYIVYHLMHFTIGNAHPQFERGHVYHNVVSAFQNPAIVAVYVFATLALAGHLYHGVNSAFQTLGLNNPRYNAWRRPFATGTAVIIPGGMVIVPLAVLFGIVS